VDGHVVVSALLPSVVVPNQGTFNVVYVATENDTMYAFNADTGAQIWKTSLLGPARRLPMKPPRE